MLCPPLLHLLRVISSFRYSLCQRFQKCCLSCWICCHLEGLWNFAHANWLVNRQWGNAGSGGLRKWGLRDRFGSVNIGVNGCKLRIDSISIMSVLNCSNVSNSLPTTSLRWRLEDFTAASHSPPKCGEWGGIKRHSICLLARNAFTFSLWSSDCNGSWSSRNSLFAPMKLVPLSEWMVEQSPRRAINLRRAAMKASLVRSSTSSICTALTARHTKMAT